MQVNTGFAAHPQAQIVNGKPVDPKLEKKLRDTAQQYEATFLNQMFSHMFEGLKADGPMDGGSSETLMRSLLTEQYANSVARHGGIGLAQPIYREMLKMQEAAQQ